MNVRVRFFAQFGELFGPETLQKTLPGTTFTSLIKEIASKNQEGYDAIFDELGAFREFVILMKNGKRVDIADAAKTGVDDGDEIAVFPPVAGG
ncbi:MAG: MoaD family protein [Methanoregula sp.]|nr:MAG: MoaD family protein [Methanoregula sp.]